jgi:hypothetical protein
MTVGDSIVNYLGKQFAIGNVIPFATLNDPRVPILKGTDAKLPAEDGGLDAAVHSADLEGPRRSPFQWFQESMLV